MDTVIKEVNAQEPGLHLLFAQWYESEWQFAPTITMERLAALRSPDVPYQAAVWKDGVPIATGGIYHTVSIHRTYPHLAQLQPWLALVYTVPEQRGKGIGAMLCRYLMDHAQQLGYRSMYLHTRTAQSLYERLGWTVREEVEVGERTFAIMQLDLGAGLGV